MQEDGTHQDGTREKVAPLTLSIVIPVKDDAPHLERCLRLIALQVRPPDEIIVVDNGSCDDGAEVARRYGARVVVELAPGIAAAASAGYDAARGTVIVRCDADTRAPADWLERIERAFVGEPELDALTGTGRFYDVGRWHGALTGGAYLHGYYATCHAALGHPPLWGSNMAFRTSSWERVSSAVHRADPHLHDDLDLAFVLGPRAQIRYDRSLVVGVSGRSLAGGALLKRRFARAFHTLAVNWSEVPPSRRWSIRLSDRWGRR